MKIYLVGGAVRDQLLQYPSDENDWVVVGTTPEQMLAQGYQQVGKDFPVFLHPETKDEYALARKERKTGHGYTGFSFSVEPDVTLEEDLLRRDLTINAIARADDGSLIDPFRGADDIENKILRHVSAAFAEDPVRILRIARFAARYHHLGFTIAEETMDLMRSMVEAGEVDHLVPERVWKEFSRALMERHPEVFIQTLLACDALHVVMPQLNKLFTSANDTNAQHANIAPVEALPEPAQQALKSLMASVEMEAPAHVRFATLLHPLDSHLTEIALSQATPIKKLKAESNVSHLAAKISPPSDYIELAQLVTLYSKFALLEANNAERIIALFKALDVYRKEHRFYDFLICCQAINNACLLSSNFEHGAQLRKALQASKAIEAKELLQEGFAGVALGEELDKRRQQLIKESLAHDGHA